MVLGDFFNGGKISWYFIHKILFPTHFTWAESLQLLFLRTKAFKILGLVFSFNFCVESLPWAPVLGPRGLLLHRLILTSFNRLNGEIRIHLLALAPSV